MTRRRSPLPLGALWALVTLLSLPPVAAFAAETPAEPAAKGETKTTAAAAEAPPEPISVRREHRLRAGGVDLAYSTLAEEIHLHDAAGEPTASLFTISYLVEPAAGEGQRPLTFVWNGGPGSASIWLHFGLVGPQIIDAPSDASDPGGPPYRLRDNPWTLLRATDLVFVDPVGTGFSRPLGEKENADFWGFDEDADSIAELIRVYLTRHARWNSPKYLLGESYGGIRAALLVPRLQQDLSIGLNGVILISPALNLGTLPFVVAGNDLPFATHLPALAATAHYHGKVRGDWPDLETLLAEVEAYAGGEYLTALFQGDLLAPEERERVAARVAAYTGLSPQYVLRSDLRIYALRFIKELLRDEGLSVGLLDGRYTQDELDDAGELPDGDPAGAKTGPVYVELFQRYLRAELGVELTRRYVPLNLEANQAWKRPAGTTNAFSGYVDVTAGLAQGTKDNESLRVFAASGYHDLTTSYFATEYMLHHSGIDRARLTIRNYEGGHMMYLYQPALEAVADDLVAFIAAGD